MSASVGDVAEVDGVRIAGADIQMPHGDSVEIFVRNRHPAGVTAFPGARIVVMMHGSTYPATAFDLPVGGMSWMDYIAARGYDVYAFDLPGYGRSTRPAALEQPADRNPPVTRTPDAIRALGAVIDFALKRRGAAKLNLIGWSWGTTITAAYTAGHADKVERLALYAPVWLRTTPSLVQVEGKVGAYRMVTREEARHRWLTGVPEAKRDALIPPGWFEMWAEATFATDPKGEGRTLRAPNGVVQDGLDYWAATPPQPYWDPARITVPTLLVLGEWDRDTPPYMAQAIFPLLTNAPWRRHVVLSEGTHTMLLEKNRMLLLRTVQQFLEEPAPSPAATA